MSAVDIIQSCIIATPINICGKYICSLIFTVMGCRLESRGIVGSFPVMA
jgi:hypothetical protein